MKKLFLIFTVWLLLPLAAWGADYDSNQQGDRVFAAEVTKILAEEQVSLPGGGSVLQQKVEITGSEGEYLNKIIIINGIGDPDATNKHLYKVGDRVAIEASKDADGNVKYYITDYIRSDKILWLFGVFVAVVLLVGRGKGLRSLLSLGLTFLVIMEYILPQIVDGSDPVVVSVIGSLGILLAIVYLTEGFNVSAHLASLSIFFSLLFTVFLSWFFVNITKLSGLANEEASFLVGYGNNIMNFQGLLLAGIIIGALGVLDDVVLSQVTAVEELHAVDANLGKKELFSKAYNIGVSHISSMVNTLFLAYAGASLPLLILFFTGQSAFVNFTDILNNEALATEIVRTLTGSIGLVLAVPTSTLLAVWWYKRR